MHAAAGQVKREGINHDDLAIGEAALKNCLGLLILLFHDLAHALVVITLAKNDVASHPALAPVPECAESDVKSFYLAPVGNGPFMMDGKWEDGQEINLKKFDDYYGDKAKIDGIHFQVIKDMETAYKEFQAGNLDVCDVPVAQIAARSPRSFDDAFRR